MVLLVLFCAALGVAKVFPHLPVGRALNGVLIEQPARFLATLTPLKIVVGVVLTAGVLTFAPAMPAEMAFLAAGDAALYIELLAAVAAVAIRTAGLRIVSRVVSRVGQVMIRVARLGRRSATVRKYRRPQAGGSDPESEPKLAFA